MLVPRPFDFLEQEAVAELCSDADEAAPGEDADDQIPRYDPVDLPAFQPLEGNEAFGERLWLQLGILRWSLIVIAPRPFADKLGSDQSPFSFCIRGFWAGTAWLFGTQRNLSDALLGCRG